ncbi:hypothetical protein DFH94DRAFT_394802 [Russula ochroleuca]|uniref:Uncharacterized protein n=1 Tax=Russula ochroleuca TaxID=152965 RepID=A0A9P5JV17_9AGAM|nr:hypothetical protein DFH94DRAFT_394802 [Russula ochroleuca]
MSSLPSSQSSDDDDLHTHRSQTSSRRVLAQVLARKERDAQQMHQLLKLTLAKLDEQSQRATDAERRATECLVRARTAMDARAQADTNAAAARAELALYKMQLEQAQREISRAQEYLDSLEARRHDAEQDAARARSVARKLQEERASEAAREQGKQQGYNEGLRQGIILGRREAENNRPRTRRRQEEDQDWRPQSRSRRPADVHFTQVIPETPQQSPPERSFADDERHRVMPGLNPDQLMFSDAVRNHTPDEPLYDSPSPSPSFSPSPPQRSRSRSQSRPRLEAPAPEPARSRPYAPHEDSTPSIIHPIPIPASVSSMGPLPLHPSPSPSPRHPFVRIPPDNWIPRAQDTAGDGRLSIFLPPPHELIDPVRPDGPYAIVATPEEGSPAVVPPPPMLSRSPGPGNRRSPDYAYATPPPPDLGPPVRIPNASRSREFLYAATPPPPDLGPAAAPRARNNATAQPPLPPPPPPDLGPASGEHAFIPQQIATINSHASTHLSEFDLLAPVGQPRMSSNIGPPPAEEDELEYIDAQTEPIPRQPIAPEPPLQRRHAHVTKRPSRGPPRPRNIVMPAPLSQDPAQPAVPSGPSYAPVHQQHGMYMQQQQQQQQPRAHVQDDEEDEDAPVHVTAPSNRPQRTQTQSSIGISVQPPVRTAVLCSLTKSNSSSCSHPKTPRLLPVTRRNAAWTSSALSMQRAICQCRPWTTLCRAISHVQRRHRRNNNSRWLLCLNSQVSRPTLQVFYHQHW